MHACVHMHSILRIIMTSAHNLKSVYCAIACNAHSCGYSSCVDVSGFMIACFTRLTSLPGLDVLSQLYTEGFA